MGQWGHEAVGLAAYNAITYHSSYQNKVKPNRGPREV